MVAGRQEGVELLGVEEEVGEVLEVTVDEGVLEALVVVVAVVVAAEDSEVVADSEAHNTSDAQHIFSPTVFMRHHCLQANEKAEASLHQELRLEGVDFLFGFFESAYSVQLRSQSLRQRRVRA